MKTKFYSNDFSCEMERDGMAIHGIIINGYKATAPSEPHDGVYIKPRGSNMPKQLVIPGEIKNLPVIAIGNYAFAKERLTEFVVPESVKRVSFFIIGD